MEVFPCVYMDYGEFTYKLRIAVTSIYVMIKNMLNISYLNTFHIGLKRIRNI